MSKEERKTRSDKGLVMATRRDQYCIAWIAEMYAARADQIRKLLSRFPDKDKPFKQDGLMAETTLRDHIARWKQAGWIDFKRVLADEAGYAWVTKRGLQLVDLDTIYRAAEPASTRLHHIYAVNQLRLWMDYKYSWKSERRYRSEQFKKLKKGESLGAILDGLITGKDGAVVAIEAEITAKKPADVFSKIARLVRRYESTGLAFEAAFPTIWFYVPSQQIKTLIEDAIADLRDDAERGRVSVAIEEDLWASRYHR